VRRRPFPPPVVGWHRAFCHPPTALTDVLARPPAVRRGPSRGCRRGAVARRAAERHDRARKARKSPPCTRPSTSGRLGRRVPLQGAPRRCAELGVGRG
jgi:hypothetical protein